MDPVGARNLKIALGEPTRAALSVRVADIRHVSAPARENVPNVRGKYARSLVVWDAVLGTVLRTNEARPSRRKRAVGSPHVLALRRSLGVVGDERSRPRSHDKGIMCAVATGPNAIPVSLEWGNQLLNTAERTNTSDGHAEGTQPLSETRWESGLGSILTEEAPGETTASRRKPAEATEDDYRPDATEIETYWWRETCTKEPYGQGGA
ncbi:hypothetical protein ENH_00070150 [Eimeria necatrix]|uniref:Uncharacterized protein n=1 Tax=Eimeria necatrix TaxID=51315 RepID=U6MKB9_9EIME|nr:hypothetical protein ENH_00070150 [Eimeria necatrix]CDJ64466.1 hypothetical protein ENH_00070150 [Eimeria necatrix]